MGKLTGDRVLNLLLENIDQPTSPVWMKDVAIDALLEKIRSVEAERDAARAERDMWRVTNSRGMAP